MGGSGDHLLFSTAKELETLAEDWCGLGRPKSPASRIARGTSYSDLSRRKKQDPNIRPSASIPHGGLLGTRIKKKHAAFWSPVIPSGGEKSLVNWRSDISVWPWLEPQMEETDLSYPGRPERKLGFPQV